MTNNEQTLNPANPTGIEDVIRAVRVLARNTRRAGESAVRVAERELAMAIDIAGRIRDDVISEETLRCARAEELPASFRRTAHQMVDLLADAGSVVYLSAIRFVEDFADERRPPIKLEADK